jgi:hypothetical protein
LRKDTESKIQAGLDKIAPELKQLLEKAASMKDLEEKLEKLSKAG